MCQAQWSEAERGRAIKKITFAASPKCRPPLSFDMEACRIAAVR